MAKISDEEFEAANQRAEETQAAFPAAVAVDYEPKSGNVVIELSNGFKIAFSPTDAQGLENARPEDLGDAEISPSGLGIYFPRLDADLSVPGLLDGFLGSRAWMAALGKRGGVKKTAAKAAAARANGARGGRPKKTARPGAMAATRGAPQKKAPKKTTVKKASTKKQATVTISVKRLGGGSGSQKKSARKKKGVG